MREARLVYFALANGMEIGLAIAGDGMELVDRNDLMTWGDESKSMMLMDGADPGGNYFVARSGRRVFMLMLAGAYFDDAAEFEEFLTPVLEHLDEYDP